MSSNEVHSPAPRHIPLLQRGWCPREGAAQRVSQDTRRRIGRREGCLPAWTLPLAFNYCAASFLLPEGCKGAGLYQGTGSDQVIQATAASCFAWAITLGAGGKEMNKTLCC